MESFSVLTLYTLPVTLNSIGLSLLIVAGLVLLATSAYRVGGLITHSSILPLHSGIYLPMIAAIFLTILASNLLGFIPMGIPVFNSLSLSIPAALTLMLGIVYSSYLIHGSTFIAYLLPSSTPIALAPLLSLLELAALISRAISLGLRLSINLITGHLLVAILLGLGALSLPIVSLFLALELLIAYLQAYIFTFIVCLTLSELTLSTLGATIPLAFYSGLGTSS